MRPGSIKQAEAYSLFYFPQKIQKITNVSNLAMASRATQTRTLLSERTMPVPVRLI
ncbi:hypothetical protein CBM2606_A110050 [Cupriavidus taiwanensis]|nr:hypothetical protein CBM2606_A110050 [Cupriavidus taiwanensis]